MVANGTPNPQERVRFFHPVQNGDVAQMVEHLAEDQGVSGSIPFITTTLRGLEEKNFLS